MTLDEFLLKHGDALSKDTAYERRFVEEVLSQVAMLPWNAVRPQTPLTDLSGRARRIDFTIEEGEFVRIAIEVDGYDKTGRGTGMTRSEFKDWSRREQAITAAGYRVIRIANGLVDEEPDRCARTVELVLKREREVAARLRSRPAEDADALRKQVLPAEELTELRRLSDKQRAAIEDIERRLEAEIERREATERDRSGMLSMTRYFVAALVMIVVAGIAALVLLTGGSDTSNAAELDPRCADARDWSEAAEAGRSGTFRGTVVAANYREAANGSPTFLDVGARYPDRDRLVVLIWGRDRSAFASPPESAYTGKSIVVDGEVEEYRGITQIEADAMDDIGICE